MCLARVGSDGTEALAFLTHLRVAYLTQNRVGSRGVKALLLGCHQIDTLSVAYCYEDAADVLPKVVAHPALACVCLLGTSVGAAYLRRAPVRGRVAFLNDSNIAVAVELYLYFISFPVKSVLSRVRAEDVVSFAVLSDGRIAVGDASLYCAILASLYPSSSVEGTAIHIAMPPEDFPEDDASPSGIATSSNAKELEMVL